MCRNSAENHPLEAHKSESLAMFYTSVGDGKEGIKSLLEKRAPDYQSKASEMPPFYPWWK
jgi:1,4-dihydroxy-2-naphthoyl-CoA synthase